MRIGETRGGDRKSQSEALRAIWRAATDGQADVPAETAENLLLRRLLRKDAVKNLRGDEPVRARRVMAIIHVGDALVALEQ